MKIQASVVLVCVVLAFGSLFPTACRGSPWHLNEFPNPDTDPDACGRHGVPSSRICNPDAVISLKSADIVEGTIKDIEAGVHPYALSPCRSLGLTGFKVAVALMSKMAVPSGEDASDYAALFAKGLHDAWGVGDKECNNGVVLLLAVDDRQVYISTGAGARSILSDTKARVVIERMKGLLRGRNYDEAVEQAIVDIGLSLAGAKFPEGKGGDFGPGAAVLTFIGAFVAIGGYSWWQQHRQRKAYASCKSLLDRLRDDQERARSATRYTATSCPVCLEDFSPTGEDGRGEPGQLPQERPGGTKACDDGGLAGWATRRSEEDEDRSGLLRGSGPGGATSSRPEPAPSATRPPLTLPCGHTFCDPCIARWLERNSTCPICRTRLDDDDNGSAPGPRPRTGVVPRSYDPTWYANEFAFRLGSIQRRYPLFITDSMTREWTEQARRDEAFRWSHTSDFLARDPAVRAQHASQGASGSSSGFGGGSSQGGGGAGGSW